MLWDLLRFLDGSLCSICRRATIAAGNSTVAGGGHGNLRARAPGRSVARSPAVRPSHCPVSRGSGEDTPAKALTLKFWKYQGSPAKFKNHSAWRAKIERLLPDYPNLAKIMDHFSQVNTFWPGKLIRHKGDPLDYFVEKLPRLASRFAAASPAPAPTAEPLWDRYTMASNAVENLDEARKYFAAHRDEYERLHPEWLDEFRFRGIL